MGEIRMVGPGKTRGYPYPVRKKRIVSQGKIRGYSYSVYKKEFSSTAKIEQTLSHRCYILSQTRNHFETSLPIG